MKKLILILSVLLFAACGSDNSENRGPSLAQQVSFGNGSEATIPLSGLGNNDIFVVKVNLSNNDVAAYDLGTVEGSYNPRNYQDTELATYRDFSPALRRYHPDFRMPFKPSQKAITLRAEPQLGGTTNFWVEEELGEEPIEITATLMAIGEHCYIWAAEDDDPETNDDISTETAESYQAMFDKLYALETNLFGYEMGGGPNGDGGIDSDKKISILMFDIDFDNNVATGVLGYFHGKDEYTQAELDSEEIDLKSNEMEMFYMDALWANEDPLLMYTTLAHEFQHMIHFNQNDEATGIWYNETLSVIAEDLCAHPSIGLDYNDLIDVADYAPYFNSFYDEEPYNSWDEEGYPYAKAYMYGAYLMRNYGGARLLHEISTNTFYDEEGIGAALYTLYPSEFTTDYKRNTALAFSRFGEALVFNADNVPAGANTLDKTVVDTLGIYEYHFPALNLWDYEQRLGDGMGPDIPANGWLSDDIKPHGISINRVSNISGDYTLTLGKPNDENIHIFVLVK